MQSQLLLLFYCVRMDSELAAMLIANVSKHVNTSTQLFFSDYGDTIFLAALSSSTSGSANPMIFNKAEINPGGHYNSSTGYYTVPYNGIYQFHVQMAAYSCPIFIHIYVDGSNLGTHTDVYYHQDYQSATMLLDLQAGQTVHVYRAGGAYGCTNCLTSYFWGHMISAS